MQPAKAHSSGSEGFPLEAPVGLRRQLHGAEEALPSRRNYGCGGKRPSLCHSAGQLVPMWGPTLLAVCEGGICVTTPVTVLLSGPGSSIIFISEYCPAQTRISCAVSHD